MIKNIARLRNCPLHIYLTDKVSTGFMPLAAPRTPEQICQIFLRRLYDDYEKDWSTLDPCVWKRGDSTAPNWTCQNEAQGKLKGNPQTHTQTNEVQGKHKGNPHESKHTQTKLKGSTRETCIEAHKSMKYWSCLYPQLCRFFMSTILSTYRSM